MPVTVVKHVEQRAQPLARLAHLCAAFAVVLTGCATTPPLPAPSPVAQDFAACPGSLPVARIISAQGDVTLTRVGQPTPVLGRLRDVLCTDDAIATGTRSRAALALANGALFRLDQDSTIQLGATDNDPDTVSEFAINAGKVYSFSRKPQRFRLRTPTAVMSIRGTEFLAIADPDEASITVFEGDVEARTDAGQINVGSGSSASLKPGLAPAIRTLVSPRDQVQWSLYYPPVYSSPATSSASAHPTLARASSCAQTGDLTCAFTELASTPASARSSQHDLLTASLLLSVGQVLDARAAIARVRAVAPNDASAWSLLAVIEVTVGNLDAAINAANAAVTSDPGAVAPRIALSYVQQASLDLSAAQATLTTAVDQHPDHALARARLAELLLSRGYSSAAYQEAQTAVQLGPDTPRTQLVLGFVALARLALDTAQTAFERAASLDSADPLARLGLGLGKIRRGDLPSGRTDLEAAVALSANDAVLRSYLGKGYYEENRHPLDAEQFGLARSLDPNDPTPYLYEGILNQSQNQPVLGLQNLNASITRNDNRAVYRSRLLLDQDRAARGTSQARIYNSLGFQELGIREATTSLNVDPTNAGAHRFLSDSYRALPRREVARVSELLQAQLLQDVNISPTQPSVSTSNLNIGNSGGPTSTGFSEFNALFERDRLAFNLTGGAGNDGLSNVEAVLSGVYQGISGSVGLYSYENDGFRPNNDLQHEIKNVYLQSAITPELNVQAEWRERHTDRGDLALNFDPDVFDDQLRQRVEDRNLRLGLRYAPSPNTSLLLSYIRSDRELDARTVGVQSQMFPFPPGPFPPAFFLEITATSQQLTQQTNDAEQFGAVLIYKADRFNLTAGVEKADTETRGDIDISTEFVVTPPIIPFPPDAQNFSVDADTEDTRAYVYTNIKLTSSLVATLGVSYQDVDSTQFDFNRWNPKVGLQWDITDRARLRAGYFQSVKPSLASNRTLEPSHVAGFNQLFDESDGTRSERFGVGFDYQWSQRLFIGAEISKRELEQPVFNLSTNVADFENREERTDSIYFNWTPTDQFALRLGAVYDEFEKDDSSPSATGISHLETYSVPFSASYFHANGFFANVGVTYVDQEVERISDFLLPSGSDQFTTVDLGIGYRLPRRLGLISLAARNLFDTDLSYQDDSFRTFQDEPSGSAFIPTRTFLGTLTLNL